MTGRLLYLASLVTFSFGALTFSALIVLYAREPSQNRRRHSALPIFSVICAISFLVNLALQIATAADAPTASISILSFTLDLSTSLLAPAIFHLVYAPESNHLAPSWRFVLYFLYSSGLIIGVLIAVLDVGYLAPENSDWLISSRAATLGLAAALAITVQFRSVRPLTNLERSHRRATRSILFAMAAFSAIYLARPDLLVSLLPDYLVLALFAVTLYFEQRLAFFDLLVKRGAMFAIALAGLTAVATVGLPAIEKSRLDWFAPWIAALALAPLFLLAPRISRALDRFIDRVWLHRCFSIDEAERHFSGDIHTASTAADLRRAAAQSLSVIFQAPVEIDFDALTSPARCAMSVDLDPDPLHPGQIHVAPRQDGVPFLSDDHRLLRSCARILSSTLQTVRLREQRKQQEEREQELRLLATRAELKALRAQINPHFLFNALNAIAGLIEQDPRRADDTIECLGQVFRYALRKPESEWVTVAEELAFVEAYLNVERARFGSRLHVDFEIDPAAAPLHIPAVTIQPIVENAIRHGVSSLDGPWIIRLRVTFKTSLAIEVFDNGPGFPAGYTIGSGGHGLRNIADRLTGYFGRHARLAWSSTSGETRVSLEIPVPLERVIEKEPEPCAF
jgi:hypothetical protein